MVAQAAYSLPLHFGMFNWVELVASFDLLGMVTYSPILVPFFFSLFANSASA